MTTLILVLIVIALVFVAVRVAGCVLRFGAAILLVLIVLYLIAHALHYVWF